MYRPLGKNVLVERIAAKKETESGIILKSTQEPDKAFIKVIGPDVTEVSVGEIAIVNWNTATKVEDENYIISVDNIILTIEYEAIAG
jgi:co-chaperonin GroES (HSP10)